MLQPQVQLKGHRSVGGMRASVYNSMPIEGAKALAEFMKVGSSADFMTYGDPLSDPFPCAHIFGCSGMTAAHGRLISKA